ncbi:MAG: hypothetical protein KGL39_10895 [Patescibacteria group bacterium]|nr:hypothetical protein [Patescibacteria group bacterium]
MKEEQEKNVTAIPAYNRTETTMVATKSKYEYSEFPNSIVYSTRLRGYDTAEAFELPNDLAARFNSVVLYINGLVISRDAPRSGWQRIGPTKPPIFLNSLAYVQVELLLLTTDETLPASFDINTRVGIFCSSVRNDICTMEFRVPMIRRPSTAIINQRWFLAYGGGCAGVAFDQIPDGFGKYNPVWDTMMEAFDKGDYKGFIQKGRDAGGLMIPADRLIGFFLGQVMNREIFDERPDKTFEVVVTTVLDKFDDAVVDKRAFADWVLLDALKHPSVAHLVPRLEKVCTPGQVDKYRVALADDKKTETKVAEDNP